MIVKYKAKIIISLGETEKKKWLRISNKELSIFCPFTRADCINIYSGPTKVASNVLQ